MNIVNAYLHSPRAQRALNRKPSEAGFSLIELVVVVAVLAILAAIAVPAFTGLSERAANSAVRTNLKNAYKECAYKVAMGETAANQKFSPATNDAYFAYTNNSGACVANGAAVVLTATTTATHSSAAGQTLTINLGDGDPGGTLAW